MNLIFLDTETTGNDLAKDRLCQVCYQAGETIRAEYFKPPVPMTVKSMSITHITNKMLADKPSFADSRMKKDLEVLLEDGVMVAHNARFDIAMLEAEGVHAKKSVDTLRVARYLDPDNLIPEYNLQFLRYFLGLEIDGEAHDAETDVNVLRALFERLLSKIKETIPDEQKALEKMIEISSQPSLFKTFNFGKYKDKLVEDVAKTDPGYLDWLLSEKLKSPDQDEDWIHTLKHYLGKS